MTPLISLIMNVAIFAALAVSIFYCLRLSRQFDRMQADRKAFEALIQALNIAAARAEAVIRALKDSVVTSGEMLQDKMGRAKAMEEELEIIIAAADSLANRLQSLAEKSRAANVADALETESSADAAPRTRAEKELLDAIRAKQKSGA